MRLTLQIDDELLKRLMKATGSTDQSKAVDLALQQIGRRELLAKIRTALRAAKSKSDVASSAVPRKSPRKASLRSGGA